MRTRPRKAFGPIWRGDQLTQMCHRSARGSRSRRLEFLCCVIVVPKRNGRLSAAASGINHGAGACFPMSHTPNQLSMAAKRPAGWCTRDQRRNSHGKLFPSRNLRFSSSDAMSHCLQFAMGYISPTSWHISWIQELRVATIKCRQSWSCEHLCILNHPCSFWEIWCNFAVCKV